MNIMFMKEFADGTPTNFRGKIMKGFGYTSVFSFPSQFELYDSFIPKIHTMRESFRVKKGMKLDLCNWSGKAYRSKVDKFVTQIDCVSTQKVSIYYGRDNDFKEGIVFIDDKALSTDQIEKLAVNDGFDNLEDFFKHFNKSATYNLIHWTNLRY